MTMRITKKSRVITRGVSIIIILNLTCFCAGEVWAESVNAEKYKKNTPVDLSLLSANETKIEVDKLKYKVGDNIIVSVKLRDSKGNSLTGIESLHSVGVVDIPYAKIETPFWWDSRDGNWTSVWTAKEPIESSRAILKINGKFINIVSKVFSITTVHLTGGLIERKDTSNLRTKKNLHEVVIKGLMVNGNTFKVSENFPTTGFVGARFVIVLKNSNPDGFIWESSAPWVYVNNGIVKFTDQGNGDKVTIVAKLIKNNGKSISWSFNIRTWFSPVLGTYSWSDSLRLCKKKAYDLPSIKQLLGNIKRANSLRGIGSLWEEWGSAESYKPVGLESYVYWSSTPAKNDKHLAAGIHSGNAYLNADSYNNAVICSKNL